jgi:CBS domain-containing protein
MAESKVMNATDLMTRSVVSIRPDASVLDAARLMLYHKISGLPVVEAGGTLVGIITEGDFLRRAEIGAARRRPPWIEFFTTPGRLAEEYIHASGRKVREVMSTELHTVTEEAPLPEIARLMEDRGIKRVPVVQGREVVGIVSRADLLRAVISLESDPLAASGDDAKIHQRLLAELKKQLAELIDLLAAAEKTEPTSVPGPSSRWSGSPRQSVNINTSPAPIICTALKSLPK